MKTDSTKNPAPIAPASVSPSKMPDKARVAAPEKGKLVKKKNTQAADPTIKNKANRSATKATSGARYGVRVKMSGGTAPEAGATQGNGRLLPSAIKRQSPNFRAGTSESY